MALRTCLHARKAENKRNQRGRQFDRAGIAAGELRPQPWEIEHRCAERGWKSLDGVCPWSIRLMASKKMKASCSISETAVTGFQMKAM
jgi:hypothetical protein